MRKAITAHKNFHTNQKNEHIPVKTFRETQMKMNTVQYKVPSQSSSIPEQETGTIS